MSPHICPNCGATVPPNAKACPECGSDDETGWSAEARESNELDLGLPDEEFNYEKFAEREFGQKKRKSHSLAWLWLVAGVIVLLAILFTVTR